MIGSRTTTNGSKPHIVLVIPRGEAVRNFLYSDTLPVLSEGARVTLLSVIHDRPFRERFGPYVEEIVPLAEQKEHRLVVNFRRLLHEAHFRWLWSEVAQNAWELRDYHADTPYKKARWLFFRTGARLLAQRRLLERLTEVERALSWRLRPDDRFVDLFRRLQPDLVFNGSHIHGRAAELPVKVAHRMGIPTAGFIFSWDNLTSRSRIFVPYDYYFVWHEGMKRQLLDIYPRIDPERVFVTGTPQFDFHFKPEFHLSREELAREIGFDPERPYIFYTTGMDKHFPEEHRHVAFIADFLKEEFPEVQLVVRTYVKGTSDEMKALAAENRANVIFPQVAWDEQWFMPAYEDLAVYTGCLRHAAMGINPASTVSLELMMFDKPVMNIGFDPPGSDLPHPYRWERHIEFDHYRPVADSGGVMVAYSRDDVRRMIARGLERPAADREARRQYLCKTFDGTLDGQAGVRFAERLFDLASHRRVSG
jgi:hypothetical protein